MCDLRFLNAAFFTFLLCFTAVFAFFAVGGGMYCDDSDELDCSDSDEL
jgi:hypothetical protein